MVTEVTFVKPTFERETLANGATVLRRFEDGKLVLSTEMQTFSTGRELTRRYDASNQLIEEVHAYGIQIMLTSSYKDGLKTGESYICNKRLVTHRSYEKLRLNFPDMPAADKAFHDAAAELHKLIKLERELQQHAAATHVPDGTRAAKSDALCQRLISAEGTANAFEWINTGTHTLGELSRVQSKALLSRLQTTGCPAVYACEIEDLSAQSANSGHLVIELPGALAQRQDVLNVVNRIAIQQGFEPLLDDDQRYVYLKLD
jgi:hypothetical protein